MQTILKKKKIKWFVEWVENDFSQNFGQPFKWDINIWMGCPNMGLDYESFVKDQHSCDSIN